MNIKSCRVCGGSADTDVDGLDWQVLCRGRCFEARYDSEQEAIEAWNNRVFPWIPVPELPEKEGLYLTKGFDMKFYVRDFDPNNPNDISTWCRGVIKYMEITE